MLHLCVQNSPKILQLVIRSKESSIKSFKSADMNFYPHYGLFWSTYTFTGTLWHSKKNRRCNNKCRRGSLFRTLLLSPPTSWHLNSLCHSSIKVKALTPRTLCIGKYHQSDLSPYHNSNLESRISMLFFALPNSIR